MPYPDQFIRDLDPASIESIEILTAVDAGLQFGTSGGNGAILIFTR